MVAEISTYGEVGVYGCTAPRRWFGHSLDTHAHASTLTRPLVRTALIYDFDGTLAPGDMQEHSFIPRLGVDKKVFWAEVKRQTKDIGSSTAAISGSSR